MRNFSTTEQKAVIVLGMARSGTSLTTSLLTRLGVDMGRDRNQNRWNPRGNYEDRDFMLLNVRIFKEAGGNYWFPPSFEKVLKAGGKYEKEIKNLVKKKSAGKKLWGWKGPWTNVTLPLFLPHVANPHLIVVFRNPLETTESIITYLSESKQKTPTFLEALELTGQYNYHLIKLLKKYRDIPTIYVSYEQLLADPLEEARRLSTFLNIGLSHHREQAIKSLIIPPSRKKYEQAKAVIIRPFVVLFPRFIKKCILYPHRIPLYLVQFIKYRLRKSID